MSPRLRIFRCWSARRDKRHINCLGVGSVQYLAGCGFGFALHEAPEGHSDRAPFCLPVIRSEGQRDAARKSGPVIALKEKMTWLSGQ